jgi:hypothetical protein
MGPQRTPRLGAAIQVRLIAKEHLRHFLSLDQLWRGTSWLADLR